MRRDQILDIDRAETGSQIIARRRVLAVLDTNGRSATTASATAAIAATTAAGIRRKRDRREKHQRCGPGARASAEADQHQANAECTNKRHQRRR